MKSGKDLIFYTVTSVFLLRALLYVSVMRIYSVKLVNWKQTNLADVTLLYLHLAYFN